MGIIEKALQMAGMMELEMAMGMVEMEEEVVVVVRRF